MSCSKKEARNKNQDKRIQAFGKPQKVVGFLDLIFSFSIQKLIDLAAKAAVAATIRKTLKYKQRQQTKKITRDKPTGKKKARG